MHVRKHPVGMRVPPAPEPPRTSGPESPGARQGEIINRLYRLSQANRARREEKKPRRRRGDSSEAPDGAFEQALLEAHERQRR
jgi:hypothetical protein